MALRTLKSYCCLEVQADTFYTGMGGKQPALCTLQESVSDQNEATYVHSSSPNMIIVLTRLELDNVPKWFEMQHIFRMLLVLLLDEGNSIISL